MKQQDFYNTITKEHRVLDHYSQLFFEHNNDNVFTSKISLINHNKTTNTALFPSYLTPVFKNENNLNIVKIPQKKINGYALFINNHKDLETFFKTEFKKSFRSNIIRFVKRFEGCFNANYNMFFGNITKENYTFLMHTLHNMLTNRFNQRNDSNKVLQNWDAYMETTYTMINEKKASLFVIYHNDVPVHICLNHHFNNILFVSVPSYDIDYAKFALGNVSLYKLLEWSIENHYQIMDLAYGDLEYKRRWSTKIYSFKHHIIYPKNNVKAYITALFEIKKLALKNFLKSKNIDDLVEKTKKRLTKTKLYKENYSYKFEDIQLPDTNKLQKLTENTESYNYIKKPINDFLYINKVHINDLRIFEIKNKKNYLFVGKETVKELRLS